MKAFIFAILFLVSVSAWSKDLTVLFLGNSYTYLPELGTEDDPVLPKMIQQIAVSIDRHLHLKYVFNTPGGQTFAKHLQDPKSLELLSHRYDRVILQGQSIESFELPPYWGEAGEKIFAISFPKILSLALEASPSVAVFVNWAWNPKNALLAENHPGLYFPLGHPRAGEKWCGKDQFDGQDKIDESYRRHTEGRPVTFSKVGRAWVKLQQLGVVDEDELYLPDDWSHPSTLGAFITALMLVRDSLWMDISKNRYVPLGLDLERALEIQTILSSFER